MTLLDQRIDEVRASALRDIGEATDRDGLDLVRIRYLARKGMVSSLFDQLSTLPPEIRPAAGKQLNELRQAVQAAFDDRLRAISTVPDAATPGIDLSLPGKPRWNGSRHPLTRTLDEIRRIFLGMGFTVATGPEIEDDYHNFGALNFPPDHPARDMQDTFFVSRNILLRTHTSPVQIRVMETTPPPVRVIIPGRVYRNEAISARSYCLFHQVEGLYVDRGVTFAELKGTLVAFAKQFYGSDLKYRFRPSFFPFTEPSAEMDIT
jgi:phenylalanyl-tRNA synthetase alpha chain